MTRRGTVGEPTRVLMIDPECLLAAGLAKLLSNEGDVALASVSSTSRLDLATALQDHRPHVVMLSLDDKSCFPHELLALLSSSHATRLICVSPDCDTVRVYDLAEVSVTQMQDLLPLIHNSGPPTAKRRATVQH